jgi:hypothetical protein
MVALPLRPQRLEAGSFRPFRIVGGLEQQRRRREEDDARDAFISAPVTVFGAPNDVTLSELALEMLFPADDQTAEIAKTMVAEQGA